jgi:hypothetical protein
MGDRIGHLDKASHNASFLGNLIRNENKFVDWIVTVAFYVALHYVDAALASLHIHPKNHRDRNRAVSVNFKPVATKYMRLYHESRYARYDTESHKIITWENANQLAQIALNDFQSIL